MYFQLKYGQVYSWKLTLKVLGIYSIKKINFLIRSFKVFLCAFSRILRYLVSLPYYWSTNILLVFYILPTDISLPPNSSLVLYTLFASQFHFGLRHRQFKYIVLKLSLSSVDLNLIYFWLLKTRQKNDHWLYTNPGLVSGQLHIKLNFRLNFLVGLLLESI